MADKPNGLAVAPASRLVGSGDASIVGESVSSRERRLPDRKERPRPLRGEASLVINTNPAQAVFLGRSGSRNAREAGKTQGQGGRQRHEIVGVFLFAECVGRVVQGASVDDPYADLVLLEIERKFGEIEQQLATATEEVTTLLSDREFIDLGIALSQKPIRKQLRFRSPYSFWASRLVSDFDKLAMAVLSAHHYALLPRDRVHQILGVAKKSLRGAFEIPRRYKFLGATRSDVMKKTARGIAAAERLGPVPEHVLDGSTSPQYGPAAAISAPDGEIDEGEGLLLPDVI